MHTSTHLDNLMLIKKDDVQFCVNNEVQYYHLWKWQGKGQCYRILSWWAKFAKTYIPTRGCVLHMNWHQEQHLIIRIIIIIMNIFAYLYNSDLKNNLLNRYFHSCCIVKKRGNNLFPFMICIVNCTYPWWWWKFRSPRWNMADVKKHN